METTKVFLNTWGAYNDGFIGYGWMTANEARKFMEENPEKDGGEWFIADIDNYLGVDFGNLNYCNIEQVLDTIEELENMSNYEQREIIAAMEYMNTIDVNNAIFHVKNYTVYDDIDSYHYCMDEIVEMEMENANQNSLLARYFDYEAYYRDCDLNIFIASNGVCIAE